MYMHGVVLLFVAFKYPFYARLELPILDVRFHWESRRCHTFDKVGVDFDNFFLWVVRTRFHVSRSLKVRFDVDHSPTKFQ